MKVKRIFIVSITIFLFACNSNVSEKGVIIKKFPTKKEIKISVIQTIPVILAPDEVFIMNNWLWIFQQKKDTLFDVFSLPDCNYLYSTGKKGQGPEDFIFPMGRTIQSEENSFTMIDAFLMETLTLKLDSTLHAIKSEKIFEQIPINGFTKFNDSLFCAFADCATGTTSDYEYQLRNMSDKKEIKLGKYPHLTEKKYDGEERCQIY